MSQTYDGDHPNLKDWASEELCTLLPPFSGATRTMEEMHLHVLPAREPSLLTQRQHTGNLEVNH